MDKEQMLEIRAIAKTLAHFAEKISGGESQAIISLMWASVALAYKDPDWLPYENFLKDNLNSLETRCRKEVEDEQGKEDVQKVLEELLRKKLRR